MTGHSPKTARQIATDVLNRFDPKRGYATAILSDLLGQTRERQRATDLVFGTIRNRAAVDKVIAEFSGRPVERIQPELLNIIRVASFELIYCPQTPEYSIVNEAVNIAKALTRKKQTAFVNAVLRQITRHIQNRQIPLSQADPRKTLPQTLSTGCKFDKEILPDPQTSPADYFSVAFSLPEWLVTGWFSEFTEEQVRQICFASNRRPSVYIRPNTLRTTTDEIAEKFQYEDTDFEIAPLDNLQASRMIKIRNPRAITELSGFKKGLFTVQDITASLPARLLNPRPDWKILDLCAAPGTKTTQLAELTEDSAEIIATDIDQERLKFVNENTARLGITSVNILPYEQVLNSKFDSVLLDVPCSNTGVLAKRIEVRYRINPKAVNELTKTQAGLLAATAKMLKPKGRICYSTCSIQKDENSRRVRDFLRDNPDFELQSELLTLPSAEEFDRDGGYVAIITRK
ncbi:MAG: 16S rRNA (cytosine(967)-C(5))-methyltransferase RsmB [Phycisphaerae bacterium]|nr:16S rRNA (cytosine(967)-C(5))-methyltransferase RsmB [Phycisphaerae bacterium]NIP52383.1 16S rRNA (cytosine(967)-C(5))-methyltransferase RsmB [Phycisphaerae bacterium]NIS51379.1 16S rRNA (cytosine(967)-C(5))-methyltransferase RsmB [Phycisphaerae bacterium]NIU08994.1 16S rRNA (cytosine(967)-C(5))-methyltransferase RsmB [Phycisphaerae bacterium]NIU56654.1 16S rRNA (cytosine(967)-C(5))-methyltransferase RsmB [Phycisphaerae bacterium]